ncbi:hypothetical protein M0811_12190 [Anaeramoeba ignava]|uniref:Transmembrane protein n=1 Tax=Anaeramoeba ignava TaxID=1746090 RepID=A0A9Q0LA08_ANAIG|nr:hypothetical protein M0811_12190 [Anaeramoeba ignava]
MNPIFFFLFLFFFLILGSLSFPSMKTTDNTIISYYSDKDCSQLVNSINMTANVCKDLSGETFGQSATTSVTTTIYFYESTDDCSGNGDADYAQAGFCHNDNGSGLVSFQFFVIALFLSLFFLF